MANSERQFIYKGPDDQEQGPITQKGLRRLAETGKVTAYYQVRSTLIPKWELAKDIPFLADIIAAQTPVEEVKESSGLKRIWEQMTLRAPETKLTGGILQIRPEDYETAPFFIRLAAGLVDLFLVAVIWLVIYLVMGVAYRAGIDATALFYLGLAIAYTATLFYFALYTCFGTHQTPGQKSFHLTLIRKDGRKLQLGRCFAFAFLTILLGLTTPFSIFATPSDRGLQEVITGVRVTKQRILAKKR